MKRNWRDLPVFAAQATTTDRLSITGLRAWRVKEPVSGRRYTVVRLESRGGIAGYGEGGPSLGPDIAAAKAAVLGRRANETEFIRHRLAALPAMEAAVNNALLDLTAKTTTCRSISIWAALPATKSVCWHNSKAKTKSVWPHP